MSNTTRIRKRLALTATIVAMLGGSAQAQVTYQLEVSQDGTTLLFSATEAFAANGDANDNPIEAGIVLDNFFLTGVDHNTGELGGDLTDPTIQFPKDGPYDAFEVGGNDGEWGKTSLRLYDGSFPQGYEKFGKESGGPAFKGQAKGSFEKEEKYFPATGATGKILIYKTSQSPDPTVIGKWRFTGATPVPEPETWALLALSSAGLTGILLRRRAR